MVLRQLITPSSIQMRAPAGRYMDVVSKALSGSHMQWESFNTHIKEDIMSLRINDNVSAINAHRNVVNNSSAQTKTMEKLSSGLKINRAADSPAQL